jgi:hypothetical protein
MEMDSATISKKTRVRFQAQFWDRSPDGKVPRLPTRAVEFKKRMEAEHCLRGADKAGVAKTAIARTEEIYIETKMTVSS